MAFCGKCGSSVPDGIAFCSQCGAPLTAAAPVTATTGAPIATNVAALLSYVLGFVTGIIFLVLEPYKNDSFVKFHAYQSIFFSLTLVVFRVVWHLAFGIFMFGFLWTMAALLISLVYLGVFFYWLFLMYKAYNNERYKIPFIGDLAEKQAGA
jgi:uncharacterized membrane protein